MHTSDGKRFSNNAMSCDGKIAGLYDLQETLGSGHFAVVKLARHVFTGEKVAVKVVDKTKLDDISKAHLFQEVRCMKLVQHPNVVRLYEVIDTKTKLYLILELGDGGDLFDYIMKHDSGLNENQARKYFHQMVKAISYCHELHVVHRDLKPENVLFFEKLGLVKLTDFGFSNKFSPGQKLETSCGSLAYSAPEILLGDSYDAPAVDIWSLGVILYMLVCGRPPFEKANDSETLTMILDCKYIIPSHVTADCCSLIRTMLVRDPEKRSTIDQISRDGWLIKGSHDFSEYVPLVSRQQVAEEDHDFILKKMTVGNIATKEEIIQSLEQKKYNHIAATYFLLAERKLRQNHQGLLREPIPHKTTKFSMDKRCQPHHQELSDNIEENTNQLLETEIKARKRNRKCSIVKEEDENSECGESSDRKDFGADSHTPFDKKSQKPKSFLKSSFSEFDKGDIKECVSGIRQLEIDKISAKNDGFGHKKLSKSRAYSYSSSESSDDDTKLKKKKNKYVGDTQKKFDRRRDSHDDSSDSQDANISSSGQSSSYYLFTNANILNATDTSNTENKYDNKKPNTFQKSHLKNCKQRVWLLKI